MLKLKRVKFLRKETFSEKSGKFFPLKIPTNDLIGYFSIASPSFPRVPATPKNQGCQIVYIFAYQKIQIWVCFGIENVGICYDHQAYFSAMW
jgi:hypothetical protein